MLTNLIERMPWWQQLMIGPQTLALDLLVAAVMILVIIRFAPEIETGLKKLKSFGRRKRRVDDLYPKKK